MLSSHEAPANNPNADLTGDKLMKKTLTALLGLALGTLAITPASADYPDKVVHIIVPVAST
jgi:hypothetical protein